MKITKCVLPLGLAAAVLGLCACDNDNGRLYPESGEILHLGNVYVGASATKNIDYKEQEGENVTIEALQLHGADAAVFSAGTRTPVTVSADANLSVPVTFTPTEARRFEAVLQPVVLNGVTQTAVTVRGNGVLQKEDALLEIDAGTAAAGAPLEFGVVEVGRYLDLDFIVENEELNPVTLSLDVRSDSGSFNVPGATVQVTLAARSRGGLPVRFAPLAAGEFTGIAEYTAPDGRAVGIVLHGTGVIAPASVDGASFTPHTVKPGESITLSYAISHPVNFGDVSGVQLYGLPDNVSSGPLALPVPTANGGSVQHTVTLGPPAKDGIFPLTLQVSQASGGTVSHALGNLVVEDVPATVSNVRILTPEHRRGQCELSIVERQLDYDVSDENGAADIYRARIDPILPPENSEPLMPVPYPPLAMPGDWNVVNDSASTVLSMNCNARAQDWIVRTHFGEDDKTSGNMIDRIRTDTNYTVRP